MSRPTSLSCPYLRSGLLRFPCRHGEFLSAPSKGDKTMGMGVSLLLIAVGAVLVWAVNATVSGIEIHTIGWILLAVGAIGALFSLIFWSSWGGVGGPSEGRRRTVVREDY